MVKIDKKKLQRKRQFAYLKGKWAEILATFYLRMKGYHVVARRYKKPVGEIDIIARHKNALVAVEVKQRSTMEIALHAIHTKQRRRISRAMEYFIGSHPEYSGMDTRFDVLLITSFVKKPVHIENAW